MKTSIMWLLAALAAMQVQAQEKAPPEDTEKRLEAARERLEEAAREVAELSTELGAPIFDRFVEFEPGHRRAIIGVQLDPASGEQGARIQEVSPGGPAAEAGLRRGDVIVAVNGKELKGNENPARELTRRLREIDPESKIKLRFLRDGKPRDVEVTTRTMHSPAMRALRVPALPAIPIPPEIPIDGEHFDFMYAMRGELAGMELATLTPKLGQYFGTEKGVLVVRAPEGDALKLEDGDVIVSIDGREPKNGSHATRILRSYQPGEKAKLRVMRQKRAVELDVILPERRTRRAEREERT
jgi:S1-C subfamily serine protease